MICDEDEHILYDKAYNVVSGIFKKLGVEVSIRCCKDYYDLIESNIKDIDYDIVFLGSNLVGDSTINRTYAGIVEGLSEEEQENYSFTKVIKDYLNNSKTKPIFVDLSTVHLLFDENSSELFMEIERLHKYTNREEDSTYDLNIENEGSW